MIIDLNIIEGYNFHKNTVFKQIQQSPAYMSTNEFTYCFFVITIMLLALYIYDYFIEYIKNKESFLPKVKEIIRGKLKTLNLFLFVKILELNQKILSKSK